jgi:hypothetical protein
MKTKRIVLTVTVTVTTIAVSLFLISVLSSAQPASVTLPRDVQEGIDHPVASLGSTQAFYVTFPPGDWPWYAQDEIFVHPEPPIAGHPTELCAEVVNPDLVEPHTATLEFRVGNFGIGVPFAPVGWADVEVPPGGHARGCVVWVPPEPGHWCIEVLLMQQGADPQRSQRNIDVWEPLSPGQEDELVFAVGPFTETTTISFTAKNILDGWVVAVDPFSITLDATQPGTATLRVTPPLEPLGRRQVIADVEGYVDGKMVGGFRKLDWPPVPLHRPKDPIYAESEISVWPYPPREGEPTEICVELFNLSDETQNVEVLFSRAAFGIGLPFDPIHEPIVVEIPAHHHQEVCIGWVPPEPGHFCIQVQLNVLGLPEYWPQFSQRNLDVAEPLRREVPHSVEFPVGNPSEHPVTITLGLIPHLPNWGLELSEDVLLDMGPGETRPVTLTVIPPDELPPDGHPIVDVEAYVEDELIGGFRKIFRVPVPLHRFPDPFYAEREITVHPYPPLAGEPTEICVELYNPTPDPQEVVVHFFWANFGIGLPFTPINGPRPVHLPPYSVVKECLHWIPPVSGHVCLGVELEMEGHEPQWSQRNIDVDEPLVPGESHERLFPVRNPFEHPVTITLGLVHHLPDWVIELSKDVLPNVPPGDVQEVLLTVTPPPGRPLPPDGHPIVDVEAYVEGELIGGFRKIFRPPVPIHRPKDPIYAESEIFVHPYPPRAREPTELAVEIHNPTDDPQTVEVLFSVAPFGIGLPFEPVNEPIPVEVPPHGTVWPGTIWLPPEGGLWCIQVEIFIPGHAEPFYSQRNIDVGEPLEPNTPHSRPFPVRNPRNYPVTITLGLIPHFPDWGLELSDDVLSDMGEHEVRVVTLTVTPPDDLPLDGDPIVDVEAYAEGELIGGFRKIFRPPVPVHRPRDPVYAESEIGVDPYPIVPGHPTELSVEVFNPTDEDRTVTATFSIAPFGIGLPFSTTHIAPNPIEIFVPKFGAARGHVVWEPPLWRGKFCVRVTLEMEGHEPIWSQRNIDVGEPLEPGQPHELDFRVGGWPHTGPVTITLGLINHQDGWGASLSQNTLTDVKPGQPLTATLTVTPPVGARLGSREPIVDVEAYVEGELIGGFRKMDWPPIPLHKPHERGYAESEISIDPYPPQLGKNSRVSTVVYNTGEDTVTVELEFGWAGFGMGIPFTTTGMLPYTRSVTLRPEMTTTAQVTWTPTYSGHQCVLVRLSDPEDRYEPQESQRNVDVVEQPCGETRVYTFTVYNDSPFSTTVEIGVATFNVPDDWEVTVVPSGTLELGPFSEGVITVTVRIPCQLTFQGMRALQEMYALQEQAGSVPTVDVEGYKDGELVGGIELQFIYEAQFTLYLPVILKDG